MRSRFVSLALTLAALYGCGSVPPSDPQIVISQIQGRGHASPFAGRDVTVDGVVTAVVQRGRDSGFFLQSGSGDADPTTSDAVYVDLATNSIAPPSRASIVQVTGRVEERAREGQLSVTTIVASNVTTIRTDAELPEPLLIGPGGRTIPRGGVASEAFSEFAPDEYVLDFWESVEGMLVAVAVPVVTGPTSQYRDLVVIPGGPESPRSTRSGGARLSHDEGNLDRVVIDGRMLQNIPAAKTGDQFSTPVTGIAHYDFSTPRVLAFSWPDLVTRMYTPPVTELHSGDDTLTLASYNILNLSFVSDSKRFGQLARSIVTNLRSPDVLALQEVQDDTGANREPDGVVTAERTLSRLAESIRSAGGPEYEWVQIDPELDRDGGQPGGNIRVAFMFRPDRITLVRRGQAGSRDATSAVLHGDDVSLTLSPGRVQPQHPCFDSPGDEGSRKPLAAEFRFRGETLFLINTHFASKGADDRTFGARQPPRLASEPLRKCQAAIVRDFVRSILDLDPDAAVILAGDLNEHEFRAPVKALEQNDFEDLVRRVPPKDRYSFNFEGNSQLLDHVFASRRLVTRARPEIEILHINTDVPAADAASDHDPIIVRFRFE